MAKKTAKAVATATETKTKKTTKAKTAKVEAKAAKVKAPKAAAPKTINLSAEATTEKKHRGRPKKNVEAPKAEVKTPAVPKATKKPAKVEVKAVKTIKVEAKAKKNKAEDAELFNEEINYIVARIKRAERKGVNVVGHYSYLLSSTLNALNKMGVTYKACGKHGYIFNVPDKRSAAWKKVAAYTMK